MASNKVFKSSLSFKPLRAVDKDNIVDLIYKQEEKEKKEKIKWVSEKLKDMNPRQVHLIGLLIEGMLAGKKKKGIANL